MINKGIQFTGKRPSKILYLGIGLIALGKDLLDLVFVGSLPGIGTAVTFCFTFLIWMLLVLFDRSGARGNRRMVQGLIIGAFGLIEGIGFGLNFFPLETGTVVLLYILANKAYREEKKKWDLEQKKKQKKEDKTSRRQRVQRRAFERGVQRKPQEQPGLSPVNNVPQVKQVDPLAGQYPKQKMQGASNTLSKGQGNLAEPLAFPGVVVPKNTISDSGKETKQRV